MPDLSQAEKDVALRKHELRMKLRTEFQAQIYSPYRFQGDGGTVFDAGFARFQAMRTTNYDHFKPNAKTFRFASLVVFIPIGLYAWALKSERAGREELYRSGQVAYKDRRFKFV